MDENGQRPTTRNQKYISRPFVRIVLLVLLTRLVLFGIGYYARTTLPQNTDPHSELHPTGIVALDMWAVYDTEWFLQIASHGYPSPLGGTDLTGIRAYAFFPLYPWLMTLIGLLIGNVYVAGLVISNAALVGALWFLYRLIERDYGAQRAWWTTVIFLLLPGGMILSGAYSESLFVFCSLASFYFARQRRWWLMGLAGGLASLTRSIGVAMLIPLAIEMFMSRASAPIQKKDWWALALIPAGLLGAILNNAILIHRPLAFIAAQSTPPWNRALGGLFTSTERILDTDPAISMVWAATAIIALIAITTLVKRVRLAWSLAGLILLIIPLSTGLLSMIRMVTIIWPIALAPVLVFKRQRWLVILAILLAVVQGYLMTTWTRAHFLMM